VDLHLHSTTCLHGGQRDILQTLLRITEQCLANRWTKDSRLPRRTVVMPHCQVLTCSKYHSSCPKSTRKSFSESKAAEALNFSNNDVALRDLSYYEMRSVKFAVRNSKVQDLNLEADMTFNWS